MPHLPARLHAKLFLAASRTRRRLWIGSANATQRAWDGRNFEVVAATLVGRDAADALLMQRVQATSSSVI